MLNLGSHYVDIFNNIVVVELLNNDDKKIDELKNSVFGNLTSVDGYLNSDNITFIKGEQQHNHAQH